MKKSSIALGVAAAVGAASGASAANYTLTSISSESSNGASLAALSGNLNFTGDANNNLSADGAFQAAYDINPLPNNELFNHNFGSLNIAGTGAVSGSFSCAEGTFGGNVGATLCGNYNWGGNFIDEGGAGDDQQLGPAQSIADFNPLSFGGFNGLTKQLTLTNAVPGVGGYTFVFTDVTPQVPVPAAVWLFGSALGLLGWARRKAS